MWTHDMQAKPGNRREQYLSNTCVEYISVLNVGICASSFIFI